MGGLRYGRRITDNAPWYCRESRWRGASNRTRRLLQSPELLDDLDEFVGFVALGAGVAEEFFCLFDEGALFGCAGDGDAAAAAEFEQAFVAELAECAQDSVGVDAEDGGEVFGGWESFAGFGFAVGDGAADLAGDLFVQVEGIAGIELDIPHSASHCSVIRDEVALTVTTPPRRPETEQDRDLEQRVADLEALIEEARRRARRRRGIYAAVVLAALGAAAWASFDIGGSGGVSLGRPAAGGPSSGLAARPRPGRWLLSRGPEGGDVLSLAVDPADPAIVYAGGWGNVFKSTNGGGSWRDLTQEPWTQVTALGIDPTHPDTLYAGSDRGIGKSVDGGRHWRMVNAGLFTGKWLRPGTLSPSYLMRWGRERWFWGLLVEPTRPRTVYALVAGGLFRTTDGGGHWRFVRPRLDRRWFRSAAAIDAAHPGTVYAAWTASGLGSRLYKTTDGGGSWQRIAVRGPAPSFTSLVIDADSPGTIFATDDSHPAIYRSSDAGTTWSKVTLPLQAADGLQVFPGSRGTLYATTTKGKVFTTTDGGASWQPLGSGANLPTGAVVTDPRDPQTIYAAGGHGIVRSVDGGRTWRSANTGFVSTVINSLVLAPGSSKTLYAGGDNIFKSTDGGLSWRSASNPLKWGVIALAVSPQTRGTIYAGTRGLGAFKSSDDGHHWRPVNSGLLQDVEAFAIDPRNPSTVYAVTSTDLAYGTGEGGRVFKTLDGGATWRRMSGPRNVQTLAVDPQTETVFAGTNHDLFRSKNGGQSWQLVATVPGAMTRFGRSSTFAAIAIDPLDPRTVYAGLGIGGVLKSTDGGDSWHRIAANTGLTDPRIRTLAVDPHDPRIIYASTQGGMFRSTNSAASWQPLDRGRTADLVTAFAISPTGTVFAATQGDGVAHLTPSH